MTVNDYIQQKFQIFGIQVSEADILDMCLTSKISGEDEMNEHCCVRVSVAIAKFIPSLLLRATSISEGGFSMSWNIQGIKDYYSFLCKQYGLKDELSNKPKVTFLWYSFHTYCRLRLSPRWIRMSSADLFPAQVVRAGRIYADAVVMM